mmetsp:Transcript_36295/g.58105  ORF Transcript_36295/g.58105 Transcript_36295/m.58105 type:complete len:484 (+) Transcript_36295:158-1609(+)
MSHGDWELVSNSGSKCESLSSNGSTVSRFQVINPDTFSVTTDLDQLTEFSFPQNEVPTKKKKQQDTEGQDLSLLQLQLNPMSRKYDERWKFYKLHGHSARRCLNDYEQYSPKMYLELNKESDQVTFIDELCARPANSHQNPTVNLNKGRRWELLDVLDENCISKEPTRDGLVYQIPICGNVIQNDPTPLKVSFPSKHVDRTCQRRKRESIFRQAVQEFRVYKLLQKYPIRVKRLGVYSMQIPEEVFESGDKRIQELRNYRLRFSYKTIKGSWCRCRSRPTKRLSNYLPGPAAFIPRNAKDYLQMDFRTPTLVTSVSTCAMYHSLELFPNKAWFKERPTITKTNYSGTYYWLIDSKEPEASRNIPRFELSYRRDGKSDWQSLGICKGPSNDFEEKVVDLGRCENANSTTGIYCIAMRFRPIFDPSDPYVQHRARCRGGGLHFVRPWWRVCRWGLFRGEVAGCWVGLPKGSGNWSRGLGRTKCGM